MLTEVMPTGKHPLPAGWHLSLYSRTGALETWNTPGTFHKQGALFSLQ
jgi:hypothetical protein